MSELIEGRNAVLEVLRAGVRAKEVLLAEGADPSDKLTEIRALAEEARLSVREVPRADLDRMSVRGAHQGAVAIVDEYRYASLDDLIARGEGADRSLVVALDHVVDPGNLGAVIRSAEAMGADGVVIPKRRSSPVSAAAMKTAAGAAEHLPVARVTNLSRALDSLKDSGYWVAGASGDAEVPAWEAALDGRIVLVLGSEGAGLSRLVRERCDLTVSVPLAGRTASLNVAQTASVLAYEWLRRSSGRS